MYCRRELIEQNAANMILCDQNLVIGMTKHCLHITGVAFGLAKQLRLNFLSTALQLCKFSLGFSGRLLGLPTLEMSMLEFAALSVQPPAGRGHDVRQNNAEGDDQENTNSDIQEGEFSER